MQYSTILLSSLVSLAAAAPITPAFSSQSQDNSTASAILQFEIDNDTFTSNTRIDVPGKLSFADRPRQLTVIAAGIATTRGIADPYSVRCQAFDAEGEKIGPQFGNDNPTSLAGGKKVAVNEIYCNVA